MFRNDKTKTKQKIKIILKQIFKKNEKYVNIYKNYSISRSFSHVGRHKKKSFEKYIFFGTKNKMKKKCGYFLVKKKHKQYELNVFQSD